MTGLVDRGKEESRLFILYHFVVDAMLNAFFPPARGEVAESFLRFVEDSSSEGILNADKLFFYSEKKYRDHCP